jgi:ATP-dependent Lhr-like helicase
LLAAVFPDQVACGENLTGEREVPDHPLVAQTVTDCLNEAMDADGFERLLERIEQARFELSGAISPNLRRSLRRFSARGRMRSSTTRRSKSAARKAVMSRRFLDPVTAADLGRLDPEAIARVREEAWPDAESADELHDALLWLMCSPKRRSARARSGRSFSTSSSSSAG